MLISGKDGLKFEVRSLKFEVPGSEFRVLSSGFCVLCSFAYCLLPTVHGSQFSDQDSFANCLFLLNFT
jgi:hypothetical protein